MIIVDAVASTDHGEIAVPIYHRGHLSLRSDTAVTVCLLPPPPKPSIPGMNELVISPINFSSWQNLIRITATFRDIPGVVRKLAHAIQKQTLDVLYEESATIENGLYHRVEILADANFIYAQYATDNVDVSQLLPALERRLKAICLDELSFADGQPRLKVRAMEGLRNAWRSTARYAPLNRMTSWPPPERTVIRKGRLKIPTSILDALIQPSPRVILISDTRDRVLRVLIPSGDTHFTYVRVTHLDQIGSLFQIADALSQAFTAVLTLTRLKQQSVRNDVEFLLYAESLPRAEQEPERRAIISELLAVPGLSNLNIGLSYPDRAGDIERTSYPPRSTGAVVPKLLRVAALDPGLARKSTGAILKQRMDDYERHAQNPDAGFSHRMRMAAARQLADMEGVDPLPQPQVFVSYNFKREDLFGVVAGILGADGRVRVMTGRNPDGHGAPFRHEIRDRIRSSHGFVGIWGPKVDSPWLLWELGVAQAFGIPVLILPHEQLRSSPHLKILPELHHQSFADVNLRDRFAGRWESFFDEIKGYDRRVMQQQRNMAPS